MTPNITAGMALCDALFAAGVGLFIGLFYALLAPLCRKGGARFALDAAAPAAAALWLRSAAACRMYGGFVRWYHVCACALAAAVCAAALRGPAQGLHTAVRAVLRVLCAPVRRLAACGQRARAGLRGRLRGKGKRRSARDSVSMPQGSLRDGSQGEPAEQREQTECTRGR